MSLYLKIMIAIFGLAYLVSPVDIIPDLLLPFVGWIDDGLVIAVLVYLIRYGKLPPFFYKGNSSPFTAGKTRTERPHDKAENGPPGQKSRPEPDRSPCRILGINENAGKKEIQAAYKEAVKKYHPDKLSHLGEEFSSLANEKFLEIQKAYDILMKRF